MKYFLPLILFCLFPFCLISAQQAPKGKWDGEVKVNLGTNFTQGLISEKNSYSAGAFSAWGRYNTGKFSIKAEASVNSSYAETITTGVTANIKDLSAPQLNFDLNMNQKTLFDEKFGIQMEYRMDKSNDFQLNFTQKFNYQEPNRFIISLTNTFIGDNYEEVVASLSCDEETGYQNVADYRIDAKWTHRFDKPGRVLDVKADWGLNRNDKYSHWDKYQGTSDFEEELWEKVMMTEELTDEMKQELMPVLEGEDSYYTESVYRITPLNMKNVLNFSAVYRDKAFLDKENLDLELGLDINAGYDRDRLSAANYINGHWKDSLSYRENFDYLSSKLAPRAKLTYSPRKFRASLQVTPDFFFSELSSDQLKGSVSMGKIYFLPDFSGCWKPSSMHELGIRYVQSIRRPDYLQICWFQRSGAYSNEIQMGNPDLKPSSNGKGTLYYTFHSGFFTGTLEGIRSMDWDKIEKVFNNVDEIRIYSWINSGYSVNNSVKLTLKADIKCFHADLSGYYNHFLGYSNSGSESKSSDWGMNGNASLTLKGGWRFDMRGRYQSKITRSYSSITEYVGCDAKISKDFKKFSVYLEGKDLFDQSITIATYSEDLTYAREEEYYYNRRQFSIGLAYRF